MKRLIVMMLSVMVMLTVTKAEALPLTAIDLVCDPKPCVEFSEIATGNRLVVAENEPTADYQSIQAAIDDLNTNIDPAGTEPYIIEVMPGTYVEDVTISRDNLHLKGSGYDLTIVQGNSSVVYLDGSNNIIISGFTLSNGSDGVAGSNFNNVIIRNNKIMNNNWGIYPYSASNMVIENNEFTANDNYDIALESIPNSIVRGNYIHDSGSSDARAIWVYEGDSYVIDNVIVNQVNGIKVYGPGKHVVSGNIISNVRNTGMTIASGGTDVTVTDNVVTDSATYGVINEGSATTLVFKNNRVTGSGTTDINLTQAANVSFNVFDTVRQPNSLTCSYNVDLAGAPKPCTP